MLEKISARFLLRQAWKASGWYFSRSKWMEGWMPAKRLDTRLAMANSSSMALGSRSSSLVISREDSTAMHINTCSTRSFLSFTH